MAPRSFLSSLLQSLFTRKSRPIPVCSPKPVMSTKTAQLGGTASDVTVGKVGVSVPPLIHSHPNVDHSTFLAWFNDDDVRSFLLAFYLNIDTFYLVGEIRQFLMKK